MADYQAGKRYAQAAFGIAKEQGTIAQWRSDLEDVAMVLAESDAAPLFASDRIPLAERQAMVGRVLDVQPLALNFARLLIAKGRSRDARAASDAFNRLADADSGIEHASVTTAVPLNADQVSEIEGELSRSLGKQVRAEASVDPGILGGVVVRVGDKLLDGSVRNRLARLRRQLEGAA